MCNFRTPAFFETYKSNSEIIILFAADWDHPFHCSSDSLSAAGSGSSMVVLAPLLHSGKYSLFILMTWFHIVFAKAQLKCWGGWLTLL